VIKMSDLKSGMEVETKMPTGEWFPSVITNFSNDGKLAWVRWVDPKIKNRSGDGLRNIDEIRLCS